MVIPSIDLMGNKSVQLVQGRRKVLEHPDPLELAEKFDRYGEIALIDLDAALDRGDNTELIKQICRLASCRIGGGVRSLGKACSLLRAGAEKIIVGTRAFVKNGLDTAFLKALGDRIGKDRIILALDTRKHKILTHGWRKSTALDVFEMARRAEAYCDEFLFTCVEKEGMMRGPDREAIDKMVQSTSSPVTVAGGVSNLSEIQELSALGTNQQLGMSLYTGKFSLAEAFIASLKWNGRTLPVITQDPGGQVLMQAHVTRDALLKTFATGTVWYHSRSRNQLWMKGESSGHTQKFLKIRQDCDGDALLVTAEQKGFACHRNRYSCFGDRRFSLHELYRVIQRRLTDGAPDSYTASLSNRKIGEKILEESLELVEAREKTEIIWEAADLLYFTTVLLAKNGIPLSDVWEELKRRRRNPVNRKKGDKP